MGFCVFGQNAEVDEDALAPPGFQRVLERGRIASIDKPEFVTASEAEVAADSWMLGVLIEGEARAYSLSLLNHHEVVNDVVGGKPVDRHLVLFIFNQISIECVRSKFPGEF